MWKVLDRLGSVSGIAGLVLCAFSGAVRLGGKYYMWEVPVVTMFVAGAGLLVAASYLKLEAMAKKDPA